MTGTPAKNGTLVAMLRRGLATVLFMVIAIAIVGLLLGPH
jgi:hypothetical protein